MTDQPPSDLDELVSAYLDGEATPEEVARVDADPALSARVAELGAVARAVAAPVPPPPASVRDAAIARALAAATTVDLGAERRRRSRTGLWVASVAAAVLAVLIAVPLVARIAGDDGGTTTAGRTADEDAPTAERSSTTAAAEEEAAGGGDVGSEPRPFLGTFADEQALVAAVTGTEFAPTNGDVNPTVAITECPTPDSAGEPISVYDAILDGEPVMVAVFTDPDGGQRVVVLDSRCVMIIDN
jgi:hypothetical protein